MLREVATTATAGWTRRSPGMGRALPPTGPARPRPRPRPTQPPTPPSPPPAPPPPPAADTPTATYTPTSTPTATPESVCFGSDGIATTAIGSASDVGRALVLQPDGKIVVAGYSHNGS